MTPTAVSHDFSHPTKPATPPVTIRRLDAADLWASLKLGFADLRALRSDAITIAVIYPLAAAFLAVAIVFQAILPLVFPICAGFALLGPMATLWYAARSRQRELDEDSPFTAFTPARLVAIQRLCATAIVIFVIWNVTAGIIYGLTLASSSEAANAPFYYRVFHTEAGATLIITGCLTGAVFAILALAVFFISFPLVLDRPISASQAIGISIRAILRNPFFALAWGAVVVTGLIGGAIPALLGIVIALPTLGHASWHLYRRAVV